MQKYSNCLKSPHRHQQNIAEVITNKFDSAGNQQLPPDPFIVNINKVASNTRQLRGRRFTSWTEDRPPAFRNVYFKENEEV